MKKLFLLIALLASSAGAQSVTQVFVTNAPAIAPPVDLTRVFVDTHTLQWRVTGSASACAVQIDGSSDGITWTAAGVMASQSCTANGQFSQASTITNYARVDVTSLSGASVTFLYVASSSVVAAGFSTAVPHTWGPGALGTGAAQIFTHPTGGSNSQYSEITLQPDPALSLDRHLFNVCGYTVSNSCIGQFHIGADNDSNIVISWDITTAVVGAQSEGKPFLIYSPMKMANNALEFQPVTNCLYIATGQCNNGNYALFPNSNVGMITCVVAMVGGNGGAGSVPSQSCQPNTVYDHTGAIQNSEATHIVQDTATLAAGAVVVTLTAPAAFLSATSYSCTANDQTAKNPVQVVQTSGTSVTFNGTGTDVVRFVCVGA